MRGICLTLLSALLVSVVVFPRHVAADSAAPKVYAYCVEMGVPGIQPRPIAELTKLLRELGYDGGGHAILTGPRLDETLQASDDAGLEVHLLQTSINLGPKAPARYAAEVPEAIRKLKGRPVTVVVTIEGLKPGDPAGMAPAVQALRELGDVAAEVGVRISAYNHVNSWNESVPVNVELVRQVNHPQVGFNFNVCHWLKVEGNKDYRPLLQANADKLFCVTICGAKIGAETWTHGLIQPLDEGDFDNRALLATLREIGYAGPIGIMCYGIPGDPRDYLSRSLKTFQSWTRHSESSRVPQPLFDGRTFDGWEGDTEKSFRIEGGAIVGGSLQTPIPRNEFLCTTRQFANFVFRAECKLVGPGNAGIQIRSQRVPNHHEVSGYQADISAGPDGGYWGALYDESRRNRMLAKPDRETILKALKPDDWNVYEIRCEGPRIRLSINGVQTVDYTETDEQIPQSGLIGLQIHGGPPSEAWYRKITIEELP